MELAANLFIAINEFIFYVLFFLVPIIYGLILLSVSEGIEGPVPPMSLWASFGLFIVYELAVISIFGGLALMAENNRYLKIISGEK